MAMQKKITLPLLFADGMILQREKQMAIHGQCIAGKSMKATLGDAESNEAKIGADGSFTVVLPPLPACRDAQLTFVADDQEVCVIHDVSVGEVWIAAGQSNMEFFLRYDAHWDEINRQRGCADVHMFNVPRIAFDGQKRELPDSGYWFTDQADAVESFSAPGYCFAREIQRAYGVPVGIIGCNWGGTPACAWIDRPYLENTPLTAFFRDYEETTAGIDPDKLRDDSMRGWASEDDYVNQMAWRSVMYGINWTDQKQWMRMHKDAPQIPMGPYHHYRPCGLYEHMVKKIAGYAARGVLWYQGESDENHADIYDQTMGALLRCWRDAWQDDLPFLYVQLAPFSRWLECRGDNYPQVRASQERASRELEGIYMTSVMDLGMHDDIHPKHKREVGERLAILARGKVYGEDILCEPPSFADGRIADGKLILTFENVGEGLMIHGEQLQATKILSDGKLCDFRVDHVDKELVLSGDWNDTSKLSVRFAMTPYCEVNLFNSADLPVKPFAWDADAV